MEGPSLFLAAEQLVPFIGYEIKEVEGNTKKEKERLVGKKILSIFSYGKYLFFQFDTFALRIHFLLFGSFEATFEGKKITGDYSKKTLVPRLALTLKIGHIDTYNCSIYFVESAHARSFCDYSTDVMSKEWDEEKVLLLTKNDPKREIADVLLDQKIFTGVGNIIKNEVLLLTHISPLRKIEDLSPKELRKVIKFVREYVFQFYEWRKKFELKKHYQIYRQSVCKKCGGKVTRKKTGISNRLSYICARCEK